MSFFSEYEKQLESVVITPHSGYEALNRADRINEEIDSILSNGNATCFKVDEIMRLSDSEVAKQVLNFYYRS